MARVVATAVNYFYPNHNITILGQDKEILNIGNVLNSLFIGRNNISVPKLAVIGCQSSGKSSILNSILGMDILPTGTNMVTRTPLQLELIQSIKDIKAVFGEYINGEWTQIKVISIQYPEPSEEQRKDILSMINSITQEYAGQEMNVSNKPIYLKIYSPNITNLTLIDLPGLTMVACTDRGQPKDIKERIRNLLLEYINDTETIIMAIMPARTDIEADIALDLIKECDPTGKRTVGILTKIDLMNEGTDISSYLENKVSKDLQLQLGYYGIKNRNKIEMSQMNVLEGIKAEQEYFNTHHIYSNTKYKDNLGINSLCKHLSVILVKSIKKNLPLILEKSNHELIEYQSELESLGKPLPKDDSLKLAYIHKTISKITRNYISILDDRGKNINTGREIKNCFNEFREKLDSLDPFCKKKCVDSYISNAISNCEGNHMSFPSPPVEVLEQLFKDKHKRPIYLCYEHSYKCIQNIISHLQELIDIILKEHYINRFPNFHKLITNTFINDILLPNLSDITIIIDEEIKCQENYIWTDEKQFSIILSESKKHDNLDMMRELANNYFKATIYILKDIIPKKIMYYLVNKSQKELSIKLYDKIKNENCNYLLMEFDEIHQKRISLEKSIDELTKAKNMIEQIM